MENIKAKELKINRINPNAVSPIHVNDMLVSHDGKEFFIQFLEIEPPAFLEKTELNNLEVVEAIMKVKLVVSPEFLEAVVKTLTSAVENFKLARNPKNE